MPTQDNKDPYSPMKLSFILILAVVILLLAYMFGPIFYIIG